MWLFYVNGVQMLDGNALDSLLSSLLGVVGAVFANLSGAGGGVVFIPVFSELGLTESQSVATSFAIQSFGMTAGAITWSLYYWLVVGETKRFGCSSIVGAYVQLVFNSFRTFLTGANIPIESKN